MQLFKRTELSQAINTTQMLESTLDIWGKKKKFGGTKSNFSNQCKKEERSSWSYNQNKKEERKEGSDSNTSYKKVTDAEYQKRRALRLYFHCDEKYTYDHVCKNK